MHCGWGSVVESLRFGLPLVAITVFSDQGMNARIMVRGGYGVEVERDEGDGSFTKEDVKRAVRFVMVEEEGEGVRKKAREMKRVLFSDVQIQNVYVDKFVGFLQNGPLSKERMSEIIKPFCNSVKASWDVRIEATKVLLDLEYYCKGLDATLSLFMEFLEKEQSLRGK